MADVVAILKVILVDEQEYANLLRLAELKCDEPDQRAIIGRVLTSSTDICAELENVFRGAGGDPAGIRRASSSPQPSEASCADVVKEAEATQHRIIARIDSALAEPGLRRYAETLLAIREFHIEIIRWLAQALGLETNGEK